VQLGLGAAIAAARCPLLLLRVGRAAVVAWLWGAAAGLLLRFSVLNP